MMKHWTKSLVMALLLCLMAMPANLTAQPAKDPGNLYTTWMKLALLGKNQAEIEFFFRSLDPGSMTGLKSKVRNAVLDNLRRSNIKGLIDRSQDQDDLNVVVQKIVTEIRYVGMEHDNDLRLSIKEEFGVVLESL